MHDIAGAAHPTRGDFRSIKNMTRYFTHGKTIWKFAPGKWPMQRHATDDEWDSSIFSSLEEFLADSAEATEITEEEGEL